MTAAGVSGRPPDRIVIGPVITLAGGRRAPRTEAIAIADGIVVATGSRADIEPLAGPRTQRWRLPDGACVMPGITDAHLHLGVAAAAAAGVRLGGARDRRAVHDVIAAAHQERLAVGDATGWLLGDGWSIDQLGGWPTAAELEALAPGRPVALWSHDHHARWVSPVALALAGIGTRVGATDRSGTLVRRDAAGAPTGVLHEVAATMVDRVIPEPTDAARAEAVSRYGAMLSTLGVTAVHDPGDLAVTSGTWAGDLYRRMATERRLPLGVAASVREAQLEAAIEAGVRTGDGVGRYRHGWLKLFADGALGSRSAALLEPYEPTDPGGPPVGGPSGMITHERSAMLAVAMRAADGGIAVQIHGIGDAAVRAALDVLGSLPRLPRVSHRVEHAQLVHPDDIPRFAQLGVAASVQPCHLCSDAPAIRTAWGDRARHAFPLAALARSGALIPLGTDAPVEPPDPWRNLAAAVRRVDPDWPATEAPLYPANAISVERALRAACVDPSVSLGLLGTGSLEVGAPATLLVVPEDGLRDPGMRGERLAATRPLATLIDGEVVYRVPAFDP